MNLLDETVHDIMQSGHTQDDVAWVGSRDGLYSLDWRAFAGIAAATEYDSGYGGAEIAGDLVVVFADGSWLERAEYDGSEWWEFKRLPFAVPSEPYTRVHRVDYESTLGEIAQKLPKP